MTRILTYRPSYEYKSRLQAILRGSFAEQDEPGGHPEGRPYDPTAAEKLQASEGEKGHEVSTPLLDYVEVTPSDVLESFLNAEKAVGDLINGIAAKLNDKVTIGPSISDYIDSKEQNTEPDRDLEYEFEDYHQDQLDGYTEAEVLPVLYDIKEELEELAPFINQHVGPIQELREQDLVSEDPDGEGLIHRGLEELREKEEEEIRHMLEKDRQGLLDFGEVNETNHLNRYLHGRFTSIHDMVLSFENVFSESLIDHYGEAAAKIAETLQRYSNLKRHFERTNLRRFEGHVGNALDAKLRMKRLVTNSYKKKLLEEVVKKQEEKLEARSYVDTIEHLNPESESDPFNMFLMDTLVTIHEVRNECDSLVEDLYRIQELERIQNEDYIESIARKNEVRQLHKMLNNLDALSLNEGEFEADLLRLLD